MWSREGRYNFNRVQALGLYKGEFVFDGDIQMEQNNVSTSCGCTQATWNQETKTISFTYHPSSVPVHLKQQMGLNFYHDHKEIHYHAIINGEQKTGVLYVQAQVYDHI